MYKFNMFNGSLGVGGQCTYCVFDLSPLFNKIMCFMGTRFQTTPFQSKFFFNFSFF